MKVVVRTGGHEQELDVHLRNPDATLGELLAATGQPAPADRLYVGDRPLPASCPVSDAGLHHGAVLGPEPTAADRVPEGRQLVVVGGLDAGLRAPLTTSTTTVGRSSDADVVLQSRSLSRRHFSVTAADDGTLTVRDEGSSNGTALNGVGVPRAGLPLTGPDDVVLAGGVACAVRDETRADRPRGLDLRRQVGPTGTVPFNRPPRPGLLPPPEPVRLPTRRNAAVKAHFSVAAVVGPLVLAAAMVGLTGNATFALMAALSPILGIGTWLEQKRRQVKEDKTGSKEFRAALDGLRREVEAAAELERTRLRQACPDPAEAVRRAALPSVRLWERRPASGDFLHLHAGVADLPWTPPVTSTTDERDPDVKAVLDDVRLLSAPVLVDLSRGGVVGVVGTRPAALAVARSLLCQAAVHSGPADLGIGVFVDAGREAEWDWAKWLPHTQRTRTGGGDRWLSADRDRSDALLRSLLRGTDTPAFLVVLDSDQLTEGKNAPARTLLGSGRVRRAPGQDAGPQVAGIVLAATEDQLPAACTTVVEVVGDDGDAVVRHPEERRTVEDVLAAGLSVETARQCARDLARFDDPELAVAGGGLPDGVRLLPLLELERVDAASVRRRWEASRGSRGVSAPVGVTEQGVFSIDVVRDGPHGLVGGTTGSGKSEFLRSLVAALAAHNDPTRLTFVLIDFKGGAAFDVCSRLPHTVGTVTNLDEQLAHRALRALEAELAHRQRLFAAAGENVDDLAAYQATNPAEPLPRLLLVVDEFAMLAKDFPDVLTSLVSIAAVGRTLGVHMLLATQRPAGAVKEDILTNTNLRVALRVQSPQDSSNVIDVPDAAAISRDRAGRAYVKLGHDEIVPIQTALVTCVTSEQADAPVEVAPFPFGAPVEPTPAAPPPATGATKAPTDLDRLTSAIVDAAAEAGIPPPRRPWPEALGERVELDDVRGVRDDTVLVALADDPDRQAQYPAGWSLADGNLLVLGIPGSGTSTALRSIGVTLGAACAPADLELLVLDMGAGDLEVLEGLPHTAGYVGASDRERQVRLVRHLRAELERRRAARGRTGARTVVLVDGLGALREQFDDADGLDLLDDLYRVYADGPAVGISFAVAADRAAALPSALTAVTPQKWLLRLADPHDYSTCGLSPKLAPPPVPGRAAVAATGQHVHVGTPSTPWADEVARSAARWAHEPPRPQVIGVLPPSVALPALGVVAEVHEEPWRIPAGVRESDLGTGELVLYEGEHALVAGPSRSGKSTVLLALAAALREGAAKSGTPLRLVGAGGRRSPLSGSPLLDRYAGSPGDLAVLVAQLRTTPGPVALLVDDAETFEDADGALAGLLSAGLPDLHVLCAGRSDSLRSLYGHWTKSVRMSRTGLLLQPNVDLDGDLLGVTLPRRAPVALTEGRGYLVQNGDVQLVQAAEPA